jgi:hypothetical protein
MLSVLAPFRLNEKPSKSSGGWGAGIETARIKKGGGHPTRIWPRAQAGGGWLPLIADAESPQNFTKQQPPAAFFALKCTLFVIFSLHLTIITQ